MSIGSVLVKLLTQPTPTLLWELRADLLEAGCPADATVLVVANKYYGFLDQLGQGEVSRNYSHLASLMDIGSVGGVVSENLADAEGARDLSRKLLSAVLSEGLMILGTRQHVKAWESGMSSIYSEAAWYLYQEIWALSERLKPDLSVSERRSLLDSLFKPLNSDEIAGSAKEAVLGRLFQLVLVNGLADFYQQVKRARD
jgi:hypothetical protein